MSSASQSPTSQESSLWSQIIHNLKEVAILNDLSDSLSLRVDKMHFRIGGFLNKKELTVSACSKINDLYSSTATALDNESRLLII